MSASRARVIVGEFAHESNSFTGLPTTMADFTGPSGTLARGEEVLHSNHDINTVVSGLIRAAREHELEIVPTLQAHACPSGPLTRDTYETIRDELIERITAVDDLSGVLLALHGAMVADGYPDPEGDLLSRLRERLGDTPIVVVLDLHANVTETMVSSADLIVGYKKYPHVDLADSGLKAGRLFARILSGEVRVTRGFVQLPVLLPSMNMRTDKGPMADLQNLAAAECSAAPACLDISIFGGFPYADVPGAGACVLVYTDNDQALADRLARDIATEYWRRKDEFWIKMTTPEEAVALAANAVDTPVVLADASDNPWSGGVGDTPTLLRLLLEHKVTNAVVAALHDPESVRQAIEVGVGNRGMFAIGGKVNPEHGEPVRTEAYVRLVSDGKYVKLGPMGHGQHASIGRAAVLEIDGVEVVVCEGRTSVGDPEILRRLGIEPTRRRVLALKAKGHFRAAFGSIVKQIIDVDAPGAASFDVTRFGHRHVRRPIYPYDRDAEPAIAVGEER